MSNKGFGYVQFEKIEDARTVLKSLNGKYMPGFEQWPKTLMVDYFVPKDRRQNYLESNPMAFPQGIPGQFPPFPQMIFPMQIPNQYNTQFMYPGNYKLAFNNNHKQRYNKGYQHRGRGGRYYKNNYQKKK